MKNHEVLFFAIGLFCFSCMKNEKPESFDEAQLLFNKSEETLRFFISQINQATDSLTLDSLTKTLEKKITDINFDFPPQTDLKMSEQENDSIYRLMQELRNLRNVKLENFKKESVPDTIN